MPLAEVVVELRRFDSRLIRRWKARPLPSTASEIVLAVPYGTEFATHDGPWFPKTAAVYRYWPDRWHDVITVVGADRRVSGLYCNIQTPLEPVEGGYVATDLDLDVWVNLDFSFRVMDEDEFEDHAVALAYPPDIVAGARAALRQLLGELTSRQGVFADGRLFTIDKTAWSLLGEPA